MQQALDAAVEKLGEDKAYEVVFAVWQKKGLDHQGKNCTRKVFPILRLLKKSRKIS